MRLVNRRRGSRINGGWPLGRCLMVTAVVGLVWLAPGEAQAGSGSANGAPESQSGPVVSSIVFVDGPTNPKIIIRGRDFGSRPKADPREGTSNLGKCGPISGKTGNDYGTKLWLEDGTQRWSAGFYPHVDCMGLIVTKYNSHEIIYRLGSFYSLHYRQSNGIGGIYTLAWGDTVRIKVLGTTWTAHVSYR
jgi:hypothetical protein